MPDYVCPECGQPIVSRAVLIEGTLLHYVCHVKQRTGWRVPRPSAVSPVETIRTREL